MAVEFCPTCRRVRNMRVTVSERKERGPGGKERTVTTRTYHCEACRVFVRSEDGAVAADQGEAWPHGRTDGGTAWRREKGHAGPPDQAKPRG